MHGVIVTRDGITCASTVEPEFYSNVKSSELWRDPTMCAYCAGSHGFEGTIDEDLYIEYKTVLPLCEVCRGLGALPVVKTRRRNGALLAKKNKRKMENRPNMRNSRRRL